MFGSRETEVEAVRRNDPTVTRFVVDYDPRLRNREYGAALQGNTVVNDIKMSLSDFTGNEDFDLLLNWIQTSTSLRKVKLWNCSIQQITRRCLQASANNAAIQEVELGFLSALDAESFASFLRSRRSKLKLSLANVGFHPAGDGPIRVVQEALHGNSSLHSLTISVSSPQVYTTIFPGLPSCRMITEVDLCPPYNDRVQGTQQAIQAIEEFLQSPPATLDHLSLAHFGHFDTGFEAILHRLGRIDTLTKLTFGGCSFNEAATNQFKNMFESHRRIQTLVLSGVIHFRGRNHTDNTNTQLAAFINENTTLKELDVPDLQSGPGQRLFSAIFHFLEENSTIERLNCGVLSNGGLSALVESLPDLKGVKELKFRLDGTYQVAKEDVLRAFARNGSLTKVEIEQVDGTNYFTAADLQKLHFYTLRNKHAPGMLAASMDEVPISLRPRIYNALGESPVAPTLILRDLRRLGDKVGSSDKISCRKRKRAQDTTTAATT